MNDQLAQHCRSVSEPRLVAFGSVNPTLPDWQDDLRRCHEVHGCRAFGSIRTIMATSSTAGICALLTAATERKLVVQLVLTMEDERTQARLARVPHVDTEPLAGAGAATPG